MGLSDYDYSQAAPDSGDPVMPSASDQPSVPVSEIPTVGPAMGDPDNPMLASLGAGRSEQHASYSEADTPFVGDPTEDFPQPVLPDMGPGYPDRGGPPGAPRFPVPGDPIINPSDPNGPRIPWEPPQKKPPPDQQPPPDQKPPPYFPPPPQKGEQHGSFRSADEPALEDSPFNYLFE